MKINDLKAQKNIEIISTNFQNKLKGGGGSQVTPYPKGFDRDCPPPLGDEN